MSEPAPPNPTASEETRAEYVAAWDDVGQLLEDLNLVVQRAGRRSLDLWGTVAARLRQETYPPEQMNADLLQALFVGMANTRDVLSLSGGGRPRQDVAAALPTAFAELKRTLGATTFGLTKPVRIETQVPGDDALPAVADLLFTGSDAATAQALGRVLTARREGRSYLLQSTDAPRDLIPGLYQGLAYLDATETVLASIAIIVVDESGGG